MAHVALVTSVGHSMCHKPQWSLAFHQSSLDNLQPFHCKPHVWLKHIVLLHIPRDGGKYWMVWLISSQKDRANAQSTLQELCSQLVQCGAVITRSIFSNIVTKDTPSLARYGYGVSFVDTISDLYSAPFDAVMYAIFCYIVLCYNGIQQYFVVLKCWLVLRIFLSVASLALEQSYYCQWSSIAKYKWIIALNPPKNYTLKDKKATQNWVHIYTRYTYAPNFLKHFYS